MSVNKYQLSLSMDVQYTMCDFALSVLSPQALDQTIAKDERLAVGFFQRAGVLLLANRWGHAVRLSYCN